MISIVSGPSCVGKSYFIENKKDRLLELSNLPPSFEFTFHHNHRAQSLKYLMESIYRELLDGISILVQLTVWENEKVIDVVNTLFDDQWEQICESKILKSVFILGVPYSEYKVRQEQRRKEFPNWSLRSYTQILDIYKDLIDEFNERKISYFFVEAIGDYKILEEEEFFRKIK